VGKCIIHLLLSLECLSFPEKEGKVLYGYGEGAEDVERMDYLELIARVTSHMPEKGKVTFATSASMPMPTRAKSQSRRRENISSSLSRRNSREFPAEAGLR